MPALIKKKEALVLGYSGYASAIIPEFNIRMVSSNVRPKDVNRVTTNVPDAVLFTGGEDVSPSLYGELNYASHGISVTRDKWELEWYRWALIHKIPMIGICRGMQLFTALTGGKLIQNVTNHNYGPHAAITYEGEEITVNSIHHQMCVPKEGTYELLAHAPGLSRSYTSSLIIKQDFEKRFKGNASDRGFPIHEDYIQEPEALWFPEINALGVQYHPEMMADESSGRQFFKRMLHKYILKTLN